MKALFNQGCIVMDYPFEKNEFNFFAIYLIFGPRSPYMDKFSHFSLDAFRKEKDIHFSEYSGMNQQNRMDTSRTLRIGTKKSIVTSHTRLSTGINQVVTYHDSDYKINMSDTVFSDDEFKRYNEIWDEYVIKKIKSFGMFIESVYKKQIRDVPLFINEYPQIVKVLLNYPDYWMDNDEVERLRRDLKEKYC